MKKIILSIYLFIFAVSLAMEPEEIVQKITPSTVKITGRFIEKDQWFDDDVKWSGTGVIIDNKNNQYVIATNAHVVAFWDMYEADLFSPGDSILRYNLNVTFHDDETLPARKVLINSEFKDLALIFVDKKEYYPLLKPINEELVQGERIFALGHPLGEDYTFTGGMVSAVRNYKVRGKVLYKHIQIDAAINSGNSGGPLVNKNAELVGINVMKISKTGVEGMNYAISSTELLNDYETNNFFEIPIDNSKIADFLENIFQKRGKMSLPENNDLNHYKSIFHDNPLFCSVDSFNSEYKPAAKVTEMKEYYNIIRNMPKKVVDEMAIEDFIFYYDFVEDENGKPRINKISINSNSKYDSAGELIHDQMLFFVRIKKIAGVRLSEDEKKLFEQNR